MKNKYENPVCVIERLHDNDILTKSGGGGNELEPDLND